MCSNSNSDSSDALIKHSRVIRCHPTPMSLQQASPSTSWPPVSPVEDVKPDIKKIRQSRCVTTPPDNHSSSSNQSIYLLDRASQPSAERYAQIVQDSPDVPTDQHSWTNATWRDSDQSSMPYTSPEFRDDRTGVDSARETVAPVAPPPQFRCPFCAMRFSRAQLREHHVTNVHIHRNRFACSHCDKTYAYGFHLQRHVNKMHADKSM